MIGLFVNLTGLVALVFSVVFVVSFGFQFGLKPAIGIFVLGLIASTIWAIISRGDSFSIWIIGTLAIWPIMFLLIQETNWFGLLG